MGKCTYLCSNGRMCCNKAKINKQRCGIHLRLDPDEVCIFDEKGKCKNLRVGNEKYCEKHLIHIKNRVEESRYSLLISGDELPPISKRLYTEIFPEEKRVIDLSKNTHSTQDFRNLYMKLKPRKNKEKGSFFKFLKEGINFDVEWLKETNKTNFRIFKGKNIVYCHTKESNEIILIETSISPKGERKSSLMIYDKEKYNRSLINFRMKVDLPYPFIDEIHDFFVYRSVTSTLNIYYVKNFIYSHEFQINLSTGKCTDLSPPSLEREERLSRKFYPLYSDDSYFCLRDSVVCRCLYKTNLILEKMSLPDIIDDFEVGCGAIAIPSLNIFYKYKNLMKNTSFKFFKEVFFIERNVEKKIFEDLLYPPKRKAFFSFIVNKIVLPFTLSKYTRKC